MSIGNNIKNMRKLAGLSQIELAEATGLSIGTIQGYEQERYKPKEISLVKIADALNCTAGDLRASSVHWALLQDLTNAFSERGGEYLLEPEDIELLKSFSKLNEIGQDEVLKRVNELTRLPEYKKAP